MKQLRNIWLCLLLAALFLVSAAYAVVRHPSNKADETQLLSSVLSPDGYWIASVRLEVFHVGMGGDNAVYAVRLTRKAPYSPEGKLVMNIPVNYPDPAPSIKWQGHDLRIDLNQSERIQYSVAAIDGVSILIRRKK